MYRPRAYNGARLKSKSSAYRRQVAAGAGGTSPCTMRTENALVKWTDELIAVESIFFSPLEQHRALCFGNLFGTSTVV